MNNFDYDLVVIGAGPGGYVSAIRGAQLGMKVALVEKYNSLGGTCLNVGCIPSKALLDSSEHFHLAKHKFASHGINTGEVSIDVQQMMKRKDDVITQTVGGIDFLLKKNNVTRLTGLASFVDKNTLSVDNAGEKQTVSAKNILIATGSKPVELPFMPFDKKHIVSSTEALKLDKVPEHMIVVGGGVIGLELGSVYARLGAKVTVVEFLPGLIPTMDKELGKELRKVLKKQLKFDFHFNTKVTGAEVKDGKVILTAEGKKGEITLEGDVCLVAVGRKPFTAGLNLEAAGVATERGFILADEQMKTNVDNIYAIGDVIGGAMLAHKAEEEGTYAVEIMDGQKPHIDHNLIPSVVYTWPEVSAVGKTEEELKEAGIAYKSGKFPFKASGRARASDDIDGFVKVLADEKSDEILGVHMIGPRCADMIAEAVVAMEYRASAEDIARICHAHPTFTEALKEAALAATDDRAIHI